MGSAGVAALFLSLRTRWRWVVRIPPAHFTPWESTLGIQWVGGWVDPEQVWQFKGEENFLLLPGVEPWFLSCPACNLVIMLKHAAMALMKVMGRFFYMTKCLLLHVCVCVGGGCWILFLEDILCFHVSMYMEYKKDTVVFNETENYGEILRYKIWQTVVIWFVMEI